ncbi:VanZ family protein [Marinobacter sp. VGCF2001]|uniref:VanZ family protein n=1 Tax=Marinobacter sp. VGCF2001 TaxID=3417189 RepID=UPI003CE96D5E
MSRIRSMITRLLTMQRLWQTMLAVSVVAILYLAFTSNSYPIPASANDKINHLIAFLELTLVCRLAWPRLSPLWFVPALLGFGLMLELVQANLPYREFSLADLGADAIGIGLGLLPWPGLRLAREADLRKPPDIV